jgi:hypothetical protein
MKCGDVVIMRADKLYEPYGKPIPYYLVTEEHQNGLVTIHDPVTKEKLGIFCSDLILISTRDSEKNF